MANNPIPFPYPVEVPFEGLEEAIAYDALTPEELVMAAQQRDHMVSTLKSHLSPRQFAVIDAYYLQGESLECIALRLGLTPTQVFDAQHNALKTLRKVKGLQQLLGGK